MRIVVDKSRCAGHARCNATAPQIFRLDDNGYIDISSFDVQAGDEELARRGARACPERALRVAAEDESTRVVTEGQSK
jgi:ferredoxin